MTKPSRGALALFCGAALLVGACGDDSAAPGDRADKNSPLSEAEFVARADRICAEVGGRFSQLKDPDGEGGAKPIGLGGFIRDSNKQLRTLAAPAAVADDWNTALDLLDQSADKLDQAEQGDDKAQSEALFDLQPRAQEHIDAMHVPFKKCFVE